MMNTIKTKPLNKKIFPKIEKYLRAHHLWASDIFNANGYLDVSIIKTKGDHELIGGTGNYQNCGTLHISRKPVKDNVGLTLCYSGHYNLAFSHHGHTIRSTVNNTITASPSDVSLWTGIKNILNRGLSL